MADVSVEFGAKDTGLEATLKTVQAEMARLETEIKSGELSFNDLNTAMRDLAKADKVQNQLQGMAQATKEVAEAASAAAEPARDLSEEFKKISEPLLTVNERLSKTRSELADLKDKAATAYMRTEELEDALKKIAELEGTERRLSKIAKETDAAGSAAGAAEPKLNALGNEATEMGNKVQGAGQKTGDSAGLFDAGFAKIAAAFTVGNLAAKGFEAIVSGVFSAARAIVDGFGEALDLGGRLDDLSKRTGETAGNLYILEGAFKEAGLSADQVGTTINKLQNFMQDASNGGERQTATMNKLGISMEQLVGKTPTQQMEIFAQKIAGIQDPTQRAATASEVFGEKLGGKLLPLLLEFPQTLDNVSDRTGGMADVMDESAATFAKAGDTIDAVKGKLVQFAAGILSETLPALESLGTSMEEVDAAGFGQQVGEALAPALQNLTDVTSGAIEVLKMLSEAEQQAQQDTGALGQVYDGVHESLSGFNQMIADTFKTFTPFGAGMEYLRQKGEELRTANDKAAEGVNTLSDAATEAAPALDKTSISADRFATSLQDIGVDSGGAFTDINNGATTFNSLIGEGNLSLSDMSGNIGAQIPLQTEHVALVGELNTSLGEANEKAGEQLAKIDQQVAAEYARNEAIAKRQEKSTADYAMQLEINQALADGNKEEANRLESQREHSQLTEKIMRETGMTQGAAETLASNLIESKLAASGLANEIYRSEGNMLAAKKSTTDTKTEVGILGGMLDKIAGKDVSAPVRNLAKETKDAQTDLSGISKILNVDIAGRGTVDTMKTLGLDPSKIEGSVERLDAIKGAIDILKGADPADLTPKVDKVGVQDNIDAIQTYIQTKLGGTTTANIEATADKKAADNAAGAITSAVGSINSSVTTQTDDNNIASTRATIEQGVAGIPLTFTVDPEQIKKSIGSIDVTGGAGGGVLSSIETLVSTIQGYVETIRDRLPITALA
jgi:cell division protein FtsL